MASAPKRTEDVGVNDLGDGGAVMRALRRNQPWEAGAGGPAGAALAAGARRSEIEETRRPLESFVDVVYNN